MTVLKMAFHSITGRRMVEVFDDHGALVGAIYPDENDLNSIRIISKYPTEVAAPETGVTIIRFNT